MFTNRFDLLFLFGLNNDPNLALGFDNMATMSEAFVRTETLFPVSYKYDVNIYDISRAARGPKRA